MIRNGIAPFKKNVNCPANVRHYAFTLLLLLLHVQMAAIWQRKWNFRKSKNVLILSVSSLNKLPQSKAVK